MSSSSYRIGRRTAAATLSESEILRSLFELRKRCNDRSSSSSIQEITDITFWNCHWTQRIIHSLRKLIVRDGRRFSSIKLFGCAIYNPKFEEIISMILSHNTTTKLVIKGRKLVGSRNESSGHFLPICESSTTSSSFDNTILVAIRDGISTNTSLKSLKLSGLNFTNATTTATHDDNTENSDNLDNSANDNASLWGHSMINNNTLMHFDLSDSSFSKSTINTLSRALFLNTTLQSLNFARCCLDDHSLSQILRSVKEHPSLIKLDLSRNFLAKSISTKALDAVAELLQSNNSKLKCLDISNQQPRPITMSGTDEESHKNAFKNALDALSANTSLRRINLSGNSDCFSDLDSVKALSSCLITNTGLFHAEVSSCHLTPLGIHYLAQNCVPRCGRNLKSLVLFDDEINDNSITKNDNWTTVLSSLERGLQFNSTLECLGELNNKAMDFKSRSSLQYLLNMNRAGRRAFQTENLPLAAWPRILARTSHIEYDNCHNDSNEVGASVLFTLLHGPVMLNRRR